MHIFYYSNFEFCLSGTTQYTSEMFFLIFLWQRGNQNACPQYLLGSKQFS